MSTPKNESSNEESEGSSTTTIEDALKILAQGKAFEKDHEFWNAVDKFLQGRTVLETLAENHPRSTEEDRRIASLYNEKALEYLWHSRTTLIEALKAEVQLEPNQLDGISSLTDDQVALRNRLFCSLFSKPPAETSQPQEQQQEQQQELMEQQQLSIEERLMELNASLPSGFKTDSERLATINRGLNKLGLSLYTQKAPFASFQETLPKSEDEQIDEIMAQAADELAVERQFGGGSSTLNAAASSNVQNSNDNLDTDEDSSDDDASPQDLKLSDEQLAIKHIKRRIVKSQLKLAEVVARLDEAHKAYDDENLDDTLSDDGGGYLQSGKLKLRQAQRQLQKALAEWDEELTV
jgi:hypothetical protein